MELEKQMMIAYWIFALLLAVPVMAYIDPTFARYIAAWLDAHAHGIDQRRKRYQNELRRRGLHYETKTEVVPDKAVREHGRVVLLWRGFLRSLRGAGSMRRDGVLLRDGRRDSHGEA